MANQGWGEGRSPGTIFRVKCKSRAVSVRVLLGALSPLRTISQQQNTETVLPSPAAEGAESALPIAGAPCLFPCLPRGGGRGRRRRGADRKTGHLPEAGTGRERARALPHLASHSHPLFPLIKEHSFIPSLSGSACHGSGCSFLGHPPWSGQVQDTPHRS